MKEKTMLKNDGPIKVLTDLGDEGKGRVKICFIIEYSRQPTKKGSSEKAKPASGKEGQGIMSEATAKTTPGPREMGKEEKDERNNELVGYEPLYNIQPGVKVKYLTAFSHFRKYRVFIKYCVFWKILKYSGLLPFSVFPRCQCVYTHQAGRKPALQQNWHKYLRKKHNI